MATKKKTPASASKGNKPKVANSAKKDIWSATRRRRGKEAGL